jgi:hypothetical protein
MYPHVTQFEEIALRDRLRQQLYEETLASRGRSMWREPRPVRRLRVLSLRFSRA